VLRSVANTYLLDKQRCNRGRHTQAEMREQENVELGYILVGFKHSRSLLLDSSFFACRAYSPGFAKSQSRERELAQGQSYHLSHSPQAIAARREGKMKRHAKWPQSVLRGGFSVGTVQCMTRRLLQDMELMPRSCCAPGRTGLQEQVKPNPTGTMTGMCLECASPRRCYGRTRVTGV
jgi:hypothetical protein